MAALIAEQSSSGAIELVIDELRARLGDRVSTGTAVREQHGNTLTWLANQPPDAVVFPQSTDEIVDIVRLCSEHRVPIIPFGAGTSLEGHLNAPHGGLSLDLSHMNKVLEVNQEDLDCVVEAVVKREHLDQYLRDTGLFFAVHPGADATLGGMAATRASASASWPLTRTTPP